MWLYQFIYSDGLMKVVSRLDSFLVSHGINLHLTEHNFAVSSIILIVALAVLLGIICKIFKSFDGIKTVLIAVAVIVCFYAVFLVFVHGMGDVL